MCVTEQGKSMEKKKKEILTAQEVADYLNIHPLTVHKYAREGKIPAFKIGTDWRFHKKYIEKWIQDKLDYNISGKDRRKTSENHEIK
jgi:excisionase family DNA binding protein